jgi:TP901 family phage tail tape measure protein
MATLATLFVEMGLKADKLKKGLAETETKVGNFGKSMVKTGTLMTAGITVPALAGGAALLKIGSDADSMADTIAIGTGATGEALDGLVDSATNVFKSIPTSMDVAGQAIADLNTLTGQTGKGLEDLAASEIRLAEITGEDLGGVISSTTDLFKNWGVAAEDQTKTLDKLLIASQATGVPVSELSASVAKFGPQLREMGFTLDESIALLGTFEQAGLDVNKTMMGLTTAVGKWAKEGKDPQKELAKTFDLIKNAKDPTEALQIAVDTFGQKAGPGLAQAIQEGRLSFDDLLKTMTDSDQTVLSMASSTDDAAQQFQVLKNQVIAAAIPLGQQLFQALNDLMPTFTSIIGFVTGLITKFTELSPRTQKIIAIFVAVLAVLGPVVTVIGTLITVFSTIAAVVTPVITVLGLFLNPIGLIVLAVVGLYIAWKTNLFGIRDLTSEVIGAVVGFFSGLWDSLAGIFEGIGGAFSGLVSSLIQYGIDFITWYLTLPIQIGEIFVSVVKKAGTFVADFLGKFSDLPGKLLAPFAGLFNGFFNIGYNIMSGILAGIGALWKQFTDTIDNIVGKVGDIAGKLKIWSPSRVTKDMGQNILKGLIVGMDDLLPSLDRSVARTADAVTSGLSGMSATAPALAGPAASGVGGNGLSVTFAEGAIQVDGAGDPVEVANRVGDAVVARLLTAMDRMETVGAA